jgi:hypothetical protein
MVQIRPVVLFAQQPARRGSFIDSAPTPSMVSSTLLNFELTAFPSYTTFLIALIVLERPRIHMPISASGIVAIVILPSSCTGYEPSLLIVS